MAEKHPGYHESVSQSQSYEPYSLPEEPEYDPRGYEPIHPKSRWRELARKLWVPIAGLGFLVWKFKAVALAIFKLKVFTTSASMLVSIAAYAWIWGWKFAVGFVLLLLVHEMGHVLELRRQGVPASAPLFIPFLGAVVGMKQMPKDAWREAQVALAGPILGSIGAAGVWIAGEALDSELLVALAFVGFFLNLFNLLPIVPLDGGRAMAAMSPWMWFLGLGLMAVLAFTFPNPVILLILLFAALETYRRWKGRRSGEEGNAAYYRVSPGARLAVGLVYVGLIAACAIGMDATFIDRSDRL